MNKQFYLSTNGGTMEGNINMNSHTLTNLAAPVNTNDAATKTYVDNAISSDIPAGGTVNNVLRGDKTWVNFNSQADYVQSSDLNAAFSSLSSSNHYLLFTPGNYNMSSDISVPYTGPVILDAAIPQTDQSSNVVFTSVGSYTIDFPTLNNIIWTMKNIQLNCNLLLQSGTSGNFIFEYVNFVGNTTIQSMSSGTTITFLNCIFNGASALTINNTLSNTTINFVNCTFNASMTWTNNVLNSNTTTSININKCSSLPSYSLGSRVFIQGFNTTASDSRLYINSKLPYDQTTGSNYLWLPSSDLNTTGTASSSTFLRGDNSWQSVSTAWGTITGTLSSQTDLQTSLNKLGVSSMGIWELANYDGSTFNLAFNTYAPFNYNLFLYDPGSLISYNSTTHLFTLAQGYIWYVDGYLSASNDQYCGFALFSNSGATNTRIGTAASSFSKPNGTNDTNSMNSVAYINTQSASVSFGLYSTTSFTFSIYAGGALLSGCRMSIKAIHQF